MADRYDGSLEDHDEERDNDNSNCLWGSIEFSGWPEDLKTVVKALQSVLFWLTVIALMDVFFSFFSGPVSDTFTGLIAVIVIGCGVYGLKDRNRSLLRCFCGVSFLQGLMYLGLIGVSFLYLIWLNGVDSELCFPIDESHMLLDEDVSQKMSLESNGNQECACTSDAIDGWVLSGNSTYTCEKDCFKLPICDISRLKFAIMFGMMSNLIMAFLEFIAATKSRRVLSHPGFQNDPVHQAQAMVVIGGLPQASLAQPMVAHAHTIPVVVANPATQQSYGGGAVPIAQAVPISQHRAMGGSSVPVVQASPIHGVADGGTAVVATQI
jgi:hypothetical protein